MNARKSTAERGDARSAPAKSGDGSRDLILVSCPAFVYSWPLIALGYLLAGLQASGLVQGGEWVGAAFGTTVLAVVLTMGQTVNILELTFLGLVVIVGVLNIPYVSHVFGVLVLDGGVVDTRLLFQLSNALLLVMVVNSLNLFANYYRVTDSAIVEHRFGHRDVATTRAGKQLRAEYPNVFRVVLGFGAGNLIVRDTNGDRVLLCINDVPFLFFLFRSIEHRLKINLVVEEGESEEA